jgi:hypothetical protein
MKNFSKILLLCFMVAAGIILFQAQDYNGYVDNPNIDQPPPRSYQYGIVPTIQSPLAVVTVNGYDNWDLGVDLQEPHMSVSPINPTWFFNAYNINNGHRTLDGELWTNFTPPVPTSAGDPWTTYDSLGNLYYETMKSPVTGCWVIKSTNGGVTWGSAVTAVSGNDRNTMVADQTAGPYSNYIYTAMTTSGGARFARSTDQGASFTDITTLTPHNLPGVHIAIGPNGSIQGGCVYTVTYSGSNASGTYNIHRSTDGGLTHTLRSSISGIGIIGTQIGGRSTINGARCRPYPWLAADQSYGPFRGRLYLVYCNNPGGVDGLRPDVYCRYSTDQGATWSANVVVNDDAGTATINNWFCSAWCEKTTGKLYINWYDMRNDPVNNQLVDVYATYSTTGGTSFAANQRVTNQNWTYPGGGCGAPCYKGDYHMIAPNQMASLSAWFDGRNGGSAGSYVGYFPDFALTVLPSSHAMTNVNDSDFSFCSVPGVKLYTDKVKFTAVVTPTPGTGTLAISFLNKSTSALQDSLTTYPDSLRVRIKATGGVTPGSYNVAVYGKGSNGTPVHLRNISVNVGTVGLINNNTQVPDKFYLYQNYPNPFNPVTNIKFDIAKAGMVKLTVFDITGKSVATLVNEQLGAGSYSYDFDAADLSSGVYFYRIETPELVSIKKMILVK